MKYAVESVPISHVKEGLRRREKIGPLAKLQASLDRVGQIHPITVRVQREGYELVAGGRRLAAAKALGWKKVWARVGVFSDDELRAIELEENTGRLDLTPVEASAARLRALEKAAKDLIGNNVVADKRGPKPGPAAALSGGSEKKRKALSMELSRNRRHVEAAEAHPAFQSKNWRQSHVLAASEALSEIPKRDQGVAVSMVTALGVDPKSAVKMLETIAEKPAPERKAILDLYLSDDPKDKSLAITRAAKLPPVPPPVLADLDQAVRWVDKAAGRETPRAAKYSTLVKKLSALRESEEKDYERFKAAEAEE